MKETSVNQNALKHKFNRALLTRMAESLSRHHPEFDSKAFVRLEKTFEALEMKPRVLAIRDELKRHLPSNFKESLSIILKSLKEESLEGFDIWPYAEFVQFYGIEDASLSLNALVEITRVFTSEWAVRPFIRKYRDQTLQFLLECARSSDVNVRRWASEGCRPRLPWGERLNELIQNPKLTLPILEVLKDDPELFVRKSVANHLNDITKDHPEFVVEILTRWNREADPGHRQKIEWITRHSLRTLIKAGHSGALRLIGVSTQVKCRLRQLKLNQKKYRLGEKVQISFEVHSLSSRNQKLVVDYVVHYVRANGKKSAKVFKLRSFELGGKEKIQIQKAHPLKQVTVRKHYPGLHEIDIQINGKKFGKLRFSLEL